MGTELSSFPQEGTEGCKASALAFQDFVQRTLIYHNRKVMILGKTATVFQLAAKGLEMGLRNVFAPTSLVIHGGEKQGIALPENYADLMAQYYGVPRQNIVELYDMTDMAEASNTDKLSCATEMSSYVLAEFDETGRAGRTVPALSSGTINSCSRAI